jgi:hypothetical protein
MGGKAFGQRMRLCALHGRMTKSDLARWFRRPYHTVAHWFDGKNPWGPNGEEAERKLRLLESAIESGEHFPIPFNLTPGQRISYLEDVIRDLHGRIPRTRAAK